MRQRGSAGAAAPAAARVRGVDELQIRYNSIEGAQRHSDTNFLVLPSQEYYGSPLGGHTDLLFSHPVYWTAGRAPGQPLVENDPKYGKVYHIGSADDLMEMARRENMLITMPHPRTKGSTGYPGLRSRTSRSSTIRTTRASASGGAWGSIARSSGSASTAACRCSTT